MSANWVCAFAGLSVLALVGGCGGSDNDNAGGGGCQMVVTGAVSGTYACIQGAHVQKVRGETNSVFMAIGVGEVGKANAGEFGVSVTIAGDPATGTYTYTSDEADKGWGVDFSRVSGSPAQDWIGGGGSTTAQRGGSCSLTFNKVGAPQVAGAGAGINTYEVHGTLKATLPANVSTGASGEVTVKLTF